MARLRPETLREYVAMARPILIRVAKQRTLITYAELSNRMGGPGRAYIAEVLEQICIRECKEGRPKLPAVVVRSNTQMVGGGFFGLPNTPEAVKRSTPEEWKNPRLSKADWEFWQNELENVYNYWKKHDC